MAGLRFHWRLLQSSEAPEATRAAMTQSARTGVPDLPAMIEFCQRAEECGIDGLLTDFGAAKPDSILLATALGLATEKIEFIIAYRSGLLCPTTFVQQLNTLSTLINGRFSLNIVAGHSPREQRSYGDFLPHDARYARTEEFLTICRAYWQRTAPVNFRGTYYTVENGWLNTPYMAPHRTFPELFIAEGSEAARQLAITRGTCWMRLPDTPENVRASAASVLAANKEAGLRLSIISGPTRQEAVQAAYHLIAGLDPRRQEKAQEKAFMQHSDSVSIKAAYDLADTEWLTPYLWTGAVRSHGAPAAALVGSPQEVADALMAYKRAGVSQFIISGWPKRESMIFFGKEILPLVRAKEREEESHRHEFGDGNEHEGSYQPVDRKPI
ncbi:LLM class flavin-dependent oxidoreductase [Candidatus Entotheonella palauensis]|uniref:LLM class flavin-dependent oxidoreductase n=1 Tax=Candidatus Entotheonella palauensis TaxID=93172 RepID=UPI000B7EB842|nr:LLM class flavin-dependent oxidoreductase [Candidatus Entotheonella palauensis]